MVITNVVYNIDPNYCIGVGSMQHMQKFSTLKVMFYVYRIIKGYKHTSKSAKWCWCVP